MKWLIGAIAASIVAGIVTIVLILLASRDPVPGRLRDCVTEARAKVVLSGGDLNTQVRSDIGAGAVRKIARTDIGDSTAVLLEGTRYRLLVLAGPESPSLEGDLARRLFEQAEKYQLVAQETDPLRGALAECLDVAR